MLHNDVIQTGNKLCKNAYCIMNTHIRHRFPIVAFPFISGPAEKGFSVPDDSGHKMCDVTQMEQEGVCVGFLCVRLTRFTTKCESLMFPQKLEVCRVFVIVP